MQEARRACSEPAVVRMKLGVDGCAIVKEESDCYDSRMFFENN